MGRRGVNLIWDYFDKVKEQDHTVKCKICKKDYKNTDGSTSGMRTHLK